MNKQGIFSSDLAKKITFRSALTRISTISLIITMTASWMLITTASLIAFKQYSGKNLQLMAYTLSQSVEAAVVFQDGVAAKEILTSLGKKEQFTTAIVTDKQGKILTEWRANDSISMDHVDKMIIHWLFPNSVIQPIYHRGEFVGKIEISGADATIKQFVYFSLTALTLCVILASILSIFISRRLHRGLIFALHNIADVVHDIRKNRNFSRRIPAGKIVEIDLLSKDINSLLSEIEHWQHKLLKENDSLLKRSLSDPLTGLANRAAFCSALEGLLSDKERKSQLALLFIDGNRFKDINDTYGHAVGDEVLITLANRLLSCVGKESLPARLGGDEFALILLSESQNRDNIDRVIRNIYKKTSEPICLPGGINITMTLSIGVAIADNDSTLKSVMEQADKNMYLEKQKHHNALIT
ncbi:MULTISPECIES: diguanylate cyclase domain-containing protein [unclassified Brenneria]|uniref:diguanylate cyclase domain-containing protein n=1 Tax=unclassified Brenneria TaxID=2634434 RepID=UPI001F2A0264|nr:MULTISPECIES: diguanylate cyclase [unclassified Brenneria]MEE3642537.1 diguanylate cyclase [Brenneria sp. L3_3C_1]MEE3650091.1 diguanylate cyclase [Brenneria sp. HEZEL_4_2_4]